MLLVSYGYGRKTSLLCGMVLAKVIILESIDALEESSRDFSIPRTMIYNSLFARCEFVIK